MLADRSEPAVQFTFLSCQSRRQAVLYGRPAGMIGTTIPSFACHALPDLANTNVAAFSRPTQNTLHGKTQT